MRKAAFLMVISVCLLLAAEASASRVYKVRIETRNAQERTAVASLGIAIDGVNMADGSVTAHVSRHWAEKIEKAGFRVTPEAELEFPPNMEDYHDEAEMLTAINQYATDFSNITKLFSIGTTYEGRDIWAMKISDNPNTDETEEPAFVLTGVTHAREHAGLEVTLDFTQRLLNGYGTDDYITYLVDNREIFVIFTMNPDGSAYDIENDLPYWRKNRYPNSDDTCWDSSLDRGVDLNRNYSVDFGGPGSSDDSCSEVYHGPSAFSELETQAYRDFVTDHPNLTLAIDLHTYGKLVLYPWSYQYQQIPQPDRSIHQNAAGFMAFHTGYTAEPSSDLYLAAGASCDWEYAEAGLTAFTIEMTDGDFYLPDTILPDLFNKMWKALSFASGIAGDPSMVLTAGLWRLGAEADGTDVTVSWSAIVDLPTGTYDVARSLAQGGPYTTVTTPPIASLQSDYSFVDQTGTPDTTFWYKVVYHHSSDTVEFGPVEVTTGAADDDVADDTAADDTATDDTSVDDTTADDTSDDSADDVSDDAADDVTDDASDDSGDDTAYDIPDDDAGSSDRGDDDDGGCGC